MGRCLCGTWQGWPWAFNPGEEQGWGELGLGEMRGFGMEGS